MFTLYFVAFCFVFCLSFISHSSRTTYASLSLFIPSSLSFMSPWPFVYSYQKGGEYTLEYYIGKFCHFYMTLVHILRRRNSISCAHLLGERYSIREMHIPRGRRHRVKKKTLFCLFFFMFVFLFALWCFELCLVSMLCYSHCIVFVC